MSVEIHLELRGMDDLLRKLEDMPLKAAKKIIRTEAKQAVEPWAAEMRARVRQGPHHYRKRGTTLQKGHRAGPGEIDFGVLAKNIIVTTRVTGELAAWVKVGPAGKVAGGYKLFWQRFLEFGTRKMKKFPFIRESFEVGRMSVLGRFQAGIRRALDESGLKLG